MIATPVLSPTVVSTILDAALQSASNHVGWAYENGETADASDLRSLVKADEVLELLETEFDRTDIPRDLIDDVMRDVVYSVNLDVTYLDESHHGYDNVYRNVVPTLLNAVHNPSGIRSMTDEGKERDSIAEAIKLLIDNGYVVGKAL